MAEDNALLVELDGPGVSPDTVDAVALLRLATAFARLVLKIGALEGRELPPLTGLAVIDKCAALRLPVDPGVFEVVASCARRGAAFVRGEQAPPPGLGAAVKELRSALRAVPADNRARVSAGGWQAPLTPDRPDDGASKALATTTIRVRLVGVLSEPKPVARFKRPAQERVFQLDIAADDVPRLGEHIQREMSITAAIHYDRDLDIVGGQLRDFDPVDDAVDPLEALRTWYRASDSDLAGPDADH